MTTAKYWYGVISQLWLGLLLSDQRGGTGAEVAEREVSKVDWEEEVTTLGGIMVLAGGGWNHMPKLVEIQL